MASARSRSAPSTWRCGTRWRRSPASRSFCCWRKATSAGRSRAALCLRRRARVAAFLPGRRGTGENLFSHQDARNLLRYGGMRPDRGWLQFDCALSYGLCEYQRTLEAVEAAGWSRRRLIPHGGHQMSLNIAAGLGLGGNENYPDLFQPFRGFPDDVRVEAGHIVMPELPGIGFEGKAELFKVMRQLAE